MTLIIGIGSIEANTAYVMSDSASWSGNLRDVLSTPKIWRDGNWVVGGAGDLGHIGIARTVPLPTCSGDETLAETQRLLGAWYRSVVRELAAHAESLCAVVGEQGRSNNMPSFICAIGCRVFDISGGAANHCTRNYEATGILRQYALGAMRALPEKMGAFDRASEAMRCAYIDSDFVWGPVRWLSTRGDSGKLDPWTPELGDQLQ